MVDGRVQADSTQGADSTYTEQNLLLETVLPIATIQLICHLAVLRDIILKVGIEQIQVRTADGHLPDAGVKFASRQLATDSNPLAFSIRYRLGRDLEEVLGVVFCYLVALRSNLLGEVTITVKQANRHHVNIHVAALLEVVACKDAKASGINLQRGIQSVLHAEIGY